MNLTDQQDLNDIYAVVSFGANGYNAANALARLTAKYGEAEVNRLKNAYGTGNPALLSFGSYKDKVDLDYMNKNTYEKYAAGKSNLGFTSWPDCLTKIGRANLIPQLK